ncbi:MAG: type II CAAX endopeptidase family protein, partial [Acidobacteriota bacterium]
MDLRKVFFNSAGRLRSGWRLLVFIVTYIMLAFLVTGVVRVSYAIVARVVPGLAPGNLLEDLVFRFILLLSSLGAAYICTRVLEGLPWRSLGLTRHAGWFRDLLVGSAIGIASLALATAIATVGRGLRFSLSAAGTSQVSKTLVVSLVLFIIAALAEEALFRGYPLQTLTRAQLAWLGVLLTSVPFAAVHLKNPNGGSILAFI